MLAISEKLYRSNYEAKKIDLITFQNFQNEALKKQNENELKQLENKYKKGLLDEKQYQTELAKIRANQSANAIILTNNEAKEKKAINDSNNKATLSGINELGSAIGSAMGQQSAEYKAFALASAIMSTYLAAAEIMANTAKLGPVAMGVSMAGTIAMGLANVAKISGAKFANGGIVGGSAFTGDNIHARVNSGEMILNQSQQANLFSMANNGGSGGGTVRFELEGSKLVGCINNHSRKVNNIR